MKVFLVMVNSFLQRLNRDRSVQKLRNIRNNQVVMYLIFGVLTTFVNIFSFFVLRYLFLLELNLSNFMAIVLSIIFAYVTNSKYVFSSKAVGFYLKLKEFFLFFSGRVFTLILDMVLLLFLVFYLGFNDMFSKVIVNVVVIVVNYVFSKLIFK